MARTGRPPKSAHDKKDKMVSIRFDEGQLADVRRAAEKAKLGPGEWVRWVAVAVARGMRVQDHVAYGDGLTREALHLGYGRRCND